MRPPTRSAVALLIVALVASIPLAGTAAAQQGDEDSVTTPSKLVSNEQFDEIGVQLSGLIDAAAPDPLLDAATIDAIAGSPVGPSLAYLVTEFVVNPAVECR